MSEKFPKVHDSMPFSVAHVKEQVIVRDIPEAQASALPVAQGSAPVQEQVMVLESPEVLAGPPVSSATASVQEQVSVCETPGVQVVGHRQEQVIEQCGAALRLATCACGGRPSPLLECTPACDTSGVAGLRWL